MHMHVHKTGSNYFAGVMLHSDLQPVAFQSTAQTSVVAHRRYLAIAPHKHQPVGIVNGRMVGCETEDGCAVSFHTSILLFFLTTPDTKKFIFSICSSVSHWPLAITAWSSLSSTGLCSNSNRRQALRRMSFALEHSVKGLNLPTVIQQNWFTRFSRNSWRPETGSSSILRCNAWSATLSKLALPANAFCAQSACQPA